MKSFEEVDKFIASSREKVTAKLKLKSKLLAESPIPGNCMMCGACRGICPNGLNVDDIVRSVTYYLDVSRDFDEGQDAYQEIPPSQRAHLCVDCGMCEEVCPNAVPVRRHVARAAKIYSGHLLA